jgi:MFS family permease
MDESRILQSTPAPARDGEFPTDVRRWAIVASLFVSLVIIFGGGFITFGLFFHPLVSAFHWSHTRIAALITVECLMIAVASPIVGWALERIEARFAISFGAAVATVAYLIASGAHSFASMLLAYGLLGISLGCSTFVPLPIVVAQWFAENRGLAMGIVISGAPFGGLVMTELVAHVILAFGWRAAYLAIGAPTLVVVIPLTLVMVRNEPARATSHEVAHGQMPPGYSIAEGLGKPVFWLLVAAALCYGFTIALGLSHVVEYLIVIGYSPATAASIFALLSLTAFLGCLIAGWIGDLLGNRAVITVSLFMMMAAYLALLNPRNPALMGLFQIGFGFTGAAPTALLMLVLAEAVGLRHFAFFSGMMSFALTLGNAIGPIVGGHLFDVTHSYSGALELGAAVALLAALFTVVLPGLQFLALHHAQAEAA